jgi:hypothetical protein
MARLSAMSKTRVGLAGSRSKEEELIHRGLYFSSVAKQAEHLHLRVADPH